MSRNPAQPAGKWAFARVASTACVALGLLAVLPAVASAEFLLGTAKSSGQVGEKRDGYLALIDQRAPENIKKMVADTNERRRQRYQELAARVGWTIEQAGKQAATRNFKHARPGELLEAEDGSWTKKKAGGSKRAGPRAPGRPRGGQPRHAR